MNNPFRRLFFTTTPTNVHLRLREPHHRILKDPKSPVQGPGAHNYHFQPSGLDSFCSRFRQLSHFALPLLSDLDGVMVCLVLSVT